MSDLVAKVIAGVLIVNAVLSGVKLALDKLQLVVKSSGVDSADSFVGSVLGVLGKIADFLSANLPH